MTKVKSVIVKPGIGENMHAATCGCSVVVSYSRNDPISDIKRLSKFYRNHHFKRNTTSNIKVVNNICSTRNGLVTLICATPPSMTGVTDDSFSHRPQQ